MPIKDVNYTSCACLCRNYVLCENCRS